MTPNDQGEMGKHLVLKWKMEVLSCMEIGVAMEAYHAGQGGSETQGTAESRPRM